MVFGVTLADVLVVNMLFSFSHNMREMWNRKCCRAPLVARRTGTAIRVQNAAATTRQAWATREENPRKPSGGAACGGLGTGLGEVVERTGIVLFLLWLRSFTESD
jgi:hypothetical protein